MEVLQVTLFGKACIQRGGSARVELPAKALELFCYLLLYRGQAHTREALACELWAEAPHAQSKKYLRQCMWQLQQALDPQELSQTPLLRCDHEWVALHPQAEVQVDVAVFERAFVAVRDRSGATLNPEQAQDAQAAATLYAGDLLASWYQSWCLVERARYEAMFFALLDKLIEYCCAQSQFDQGIAYGMRLLRIDHTHERTHRQLMRLYALAGDRSMALRQFEQCAAALMQEFGVAPTEPTLLLFEQIRIGQIGAARAIGAPDHATQPDSDSFMTLRTELASLRGSIALLQLDLEQIKLARQG